MNIVHTIRRRTTAIIIAATIALTGTATAQAADRTRPVDVFIGDSSAVNGAYSDGTTPAQRWTRLFSDADGADEVNVAVAGTGFVWGDDRGIDFASQIAKAQTALKTQGLDASHVRRVFVIGVGNDMSRIQNGQITQAQLAKAIPDVFSKVQKAFPDAQRLYVPEAAPMTANMKAAYQRMEPNMSMIHMAAALYGFTSKKDWDTLVNGDGTSKDGTHLNRKGNNLMAHAIQDWVNTLDGPKVTGTIPAWKDATDPTPGWHTASFDMAGGPAKDPVNVADGQRLPTPDAPKRPGWTFQGWLLDGQPYDFTQPITHDITLTATWAKDPGTAPAGQEADVFFGDSSLAGMTVPDRWSTLLAAKDKAVPIDESANGTGFNEEVWGISYARQQEQALGHLKQRGIPTTNVKRVIISTGGEDLALIAKDPANADRYIQYIKTTLQSIRAAYPNARFYLTGVGVRNPTTEKAVEQAGPYFRTMLDMAATLGWNTKGGWPFLAGDDPDYKLTYTDHSHMNKDGHAQAAPRVAAWIDTFGAPKVGDPIPTDGIHTVVFDTGLTGTAGAIPPQPVKNGQPASRPADPTRDGHTFEGWLLDGQPYDFTQPVTGNIMLTAQWERTGDGMDLTAGKRVDPTTGKDGAYTLHLSAASPHWPAVHADDRPMDILFVIDVSESMNASMTEEKQPAAGQPSRVSLLVDSLDRMIDQAAANNKADPRNPTRIGIVTFANQANTKVALDLTADTDTARAAIHSIPDHLIGYGQDPAASTNWSAGLDLGARTIAAAPADHDRRLVFITDGYATSYTDHTDGTEHRATDPGHPTDDQAFMAGTMASLAVSGMTVHDTGATAYSMLVGPQGYAQYVAMLQAGMEHGTMTTATPERFYQASDAQSLSDSIARTGQRKGGTLTIVDTLTAWADFAAGDATPVTVTEDGQPMDPTRYLAKVSAKDRNVTITLTGPLKDGATYRASLPITISPSGRHQAATAGLTDTGDPGTGPESAGRKGLRSNTSGAAIWNDGANLVNRPFPNPVIQPTHGGATTPATSTLPATGAATGIALALAAATLALAAHATRQAARRTRRH